MVSQLELVKYEEDGSFDIEAEEQKSSEERTIKYHLGPDFLKLQTVGLSLKFKNGEQPVKDMLMIERHYFRGRCIRSYDFRFDFIMPGSENSIELIYDLPQLSEEEHWAIVNKPWGVRSDTFFFVEGRLIIHNRAVYNYMPL